MKLVTPPEGSKGLLDAMERDFEEAGIYNIIMGAPPKTVRYPNGRFGALEVIKEADIKVIEPKLVEHKE